MNTNIPDTAAALQASYENLRAALLEDVGTKLNAARAQQEAARRSMREADGVLRDGHASQTAKKLAQSTRAAAQRDLTAASGDVTRLELEHRQAQQGEHPSIARERFASQQAHTRERMVAIAAAEAALQAALRSDAVQIPLRALADLGAPVAHRPVADLLKD
jgi:hypothetical protein